MDIISKATAALFGILFTVSSFGQTTKPIEYLGVPGPISFSKGSYNLAWTSHPTDNFYKQEYLAKADTLERFKRLILLDVVAGKMKLKDVVAAKVAELDRLKSSNSVVNYQTFEKDGEVMLDFLISENTADGKYLSTIERNVYRYKSIVDQNGKKIILLFGVSERAYGDDIDKFLPNLKAHRFDLINAVGAFDIPGITVVK